MPNERFFVKQDRMWPSRWCVLDRRRRKVLRLGKDGRRPFVVVASSEWNVVAERIAELLNDHGLKQKEEVNDG